MRGTLLIVLALTFGAIAVAPVTIAFQAHVPGPIGAGDLPAVPLGNDKPVIYIPGCPIPIIC